MRVLNPAAQAKVANRFGNEPIMIIDVAWNGTDILRYAERDTPGIPGKITKVSTLDSIVTISKGDDSQAIEVTLSDTDGSLKSLMNNYDFHKCDAWVYQWFEGLTITDAFLLFRGKISSPIIWNEGDRTLSFSILSQIEDKEVGFSPEEGQFPYIPKDLIGKTWPSIFGTALDVPAVAISQAIVGTTLEAVGIISGKDYYRNEPYNRLGESSLPPDCGEQSLQASFYEQVATLCEGEQRAAYHKQAYEIRQGIANTMGQWLNSQQCAECQRLANLATAEAETEQVSANPVTILGGEDFPRGEITLRIGSGGLFTGFFIDETNSFQITSSTHPENEAAAADEYAQRNVSNCPMCDSAADAGGGEFCLEAQVPVGRGNAGPGDSIFRRWGYIIKTGYGNEGSSSGEASTYLKQFWADAGSEVRLYDPEPITHIVSIVPGTVLQVKAHKRLNQESHLINVPTNLWSTQSTTYGSITAVEVLCEQLTQLEGQDWESDDIYVTFQSTIGPNIVDILTYLITTYSSLAIDAVSFAAVRTQLNPFPANFALLDRENLLNVLQDIAFQARCSLRLSNGIFYLQYLPEEPTSCATFAEQDIESQSMEVSFTPTEDLVTKYIATYRLSYAQDELDKIILRHNVEKYGTQEEEYEFYIYNQPDIVHKVATFWLIRKSNSWKYIEFTTFLHKLALETLDAVTFAFASNYVSTGNIKGIIESSEYDSDNQTIRMRCWLPVKAGKMTQYIFAWPASVDPSLTFPTDEEIEMGYAGGNGIGAGATGNLPVGDTSRVETSAIFVGGPNVVFAGQTDRGDPHPSDTGFIAQALGTFAAWANLIVTGKESTVITQTYAAPVDAYIAQPHIIGEVELSLEHTKIRSSVNYNVYGTLADFLRMDVDDPRLTIRTDAHFSDGTNTDEYHFRYDTSNVRWTAGSAYLLG